MKTIIIFGKHNENNHHIWKTQMKTIIIFGKHNENNHHISKTIIIFGKQSSYLETAIQNFSK